MPTPPTYRKVNPSDSPIMILSVQSDAMPLIDVDNYADNILSQQMSQITGVSQVLIGGEQKRSVRVQVDPAKIAAMGMTLEDVRTTLVNATADAPKGSSTAEHRAYTIYANDQLTRASEYNDVILAYRNGAAVRVRDIGRAIDAPENDPRRRLAERPARHPADRVQAARRQRHRHGGADQGGACRRWRRQSRHPCT